LREENRISEAVIGAAIEVHRTLGPGLLEATYEACLCHELALRQIEHEKQRPLPVTYKGLELECGYRTDIIVGGLVAVEIKAVDALLPIHEAQLLTYLRLGGWKLGLLLNFNETMLKNGIVRKVNRL
jgi:GxxExxY protein